MSSSDRVSETTAIDDGFAVASGSHDPSSSNQMTNGKLPKLDVAQVEKKKHKGDRDDGKHELQQEEVMDQLPYKWSTRKKWTVLTVIVVVQMSMNCEHTTLKQRRKDPESI